MGWDRKICPMDKPGYAADAKHVLLAGPQREIFAGGTKIDAGPPKFSKALTNESKKVFTQIGPGFCPKLGEDQKKGLYSNLVLVFAQN